MKKAEFGQDTLLSLCKDNGINLKQLSELTGIPYSSVRGYSRGANIPGADDLAVMCKALKESPKTVLKALNIDTAGIPDDLPPTR
jgi:transcriptional regulator with XRE-family HTH domain